MQTMKCHGCNEPTTIIWFTEATWSQLARENPKEYSNPLWVHCVGCTRDALRRQVGLTDFHVAGYLKTAKNSPATKKMLTDHVRTTLKGVADSHELEFKIKDWTQPEGGIFDIAYSVGRELGQNTSLEQVEQLLPVMLSECDKYFPLESNG